MQTPLVGQTSKETKMKSPGLRFLAPLAIAALCLAIAGQAHAIDITGTYAASQTFTGANTWTAGNVTINGAATTLTNDGAGTLTYDSTVGALGGDGSLLNDGLFVFATTTGADNLNINGPTTFTNAGTFEFASGGDVRLVNAASMFENTGTIVKTSGTVGGSNDPTYIFRDTLTTGGTFVNSGNIEVQAGKLNIASGTSTGGTFTTSGGGVLSFTGPWAELTGTTTAGSLVRIDTENPASTTGGKFTAAAATTVINVGGDGIVWNTGTLDTNGNIIQNDGLFRIQTGGTKTVTGGGTLRNAAGTLSLESGALTVDTSIVNDGTTNWTGGNLTLNADLTNNATCTFGGSGGTNRILSGAGTFTNNGQFLFTATVADNIEDTDSGGEFLNNGLFDFQGSGDFELRDGYTFTVAPGGVLRKSVGGGDGSLFFARDTEPGAGTLDIQGTIEVLDGEIEVRGTGGGFTALSIVQYDATDKALTGGTWAIRDPDGAGAGTSRLDLLPITGGIEKIGAGATVELEGPHSYFAQFTPFVNEVAGTLTVNDRTLTIPSTLALTGGTIDGTGTVVVNNTITNTGTSTLDLDGALKWQNGTLDMGTGTVVNDGLFQFAGNADKPLVGTGTFVNNGVFEVVPTGANDNLNALTSGGTFINNGLYDIQGIGDFEMKDGFTYVNAPTGIVRKSAGTGNEALFFSFTDPAGTFDNQGTVEVLMDQLEIRSGGGYGTLQVSQYDTGTRTLTGGTWIVRDWDGAGTGTSTLDLQPANAGIQVLGAGAAVELTGPGSIFPQLTSHVREVAGTLTVNDRTLTLPTTLALTGGTINGTGTVVANANITSTGTSTLDLDGAFQWKGGTLNIVSGTLVNDGVFDYTGNPERALTGTGTFLNNGHFRHVTTTGTDNLRLEGANTLTNAGLYEFASGGDVWLAHSGSVFENTGTLLKSTGAVGSSNDPSYILRNSLTSGGTFVNSGDITVTAGKLNIGCGSSTGGTFTTSGTGVLSFSGAWTELTGTAVGTNVRIDNENPAGSTGGKFVAAAATTIVNVDGDGVLWQVGTLDTNGNLLRNDGLLRITTGGTKVVNGGGTFRNAAGGTLDLTDGTVTLAADTPIENDGAIVLHTGTSGFDGTGTVTNRPGGTVDWQSGGLELDPPSVTFRNQGAFDLTTTATKTLFGNGLLLNEAGGTMNWSNGDLVLSADVTNDGTFLFSGSSPTNRTLSGSGATFTNNGDFLLTATGNDNIENAANGEFVNNGVFDFQTNCDVALSGGYTFTNAPGGVVRRTSADTDACLFFDRAGGGGGTIDNQGTIASLRGELEIRSSIDVGFDDIVIVQYNAASRTLTGGTWVIETPSGSWARLDMHPANAGITTIGAGATVELTGPSAEFPQLTPHLNEVAGTLTVNSMTLTTPGALTLNGGRIDGTGTVSVNGTTTNAGTSTLAVGSFTLGDDMANPGGATLRWENGTLNIGTHTLVNDGLVQFTGNSDKTLAGTGTFVNNGVMQIVPTGSGDNLSGVGVGGQFINNGLYDIKGIGDFQLTNGYTFVNSPTGIIRKSAGTGNEALFFAYANPAGTLDNQGTIEVLMDQLEVRSTSGWGLVQCAQYDAGTKALTGGTWIIRDWDGAGGGTSMLDLQPANAGITILGAGAAVELTGPGAAFPQLTSSLATVNGTLTVNDRTFTAPTGTLAVGGTIAGTGTYSGDVVVQSGGTVSPGADAGAGIGTLTFNGDLDLNPTATLEMALGGLANYDQVLFAGGGRTLTLDNAALALSLGFMPAPLDEFVLVSGFDTLAGAGQFAGLPEGAAVNVGGSVFWISYGPNDITLVTAPEPTTLSLLGLGALCLRLRRRRKA